MQIDNGQEIATQILNWVEQHGVLEPGKVVNDGKLSLDPSIRQSHIAWINEDWLYKTFKPLIEYANKAEDSRWDFKIQGFEQFQYNEYKPGEFYDWHFDNVGKKPGQQVVRKLSFSFALNDDFEGGGLELKFLKQAKDDELTIIKPPLLHNTGDLVIFPSYMAHRALPVRAGVRKALVGWALGPPWL